MSYTKRDFVKAAFEEIGLASYVFDLSPEDLESALRRLDAMMASWNAKGIRLGYPLPGSPGNSDLDAETGVPDHANYAIFANLGLAIAPLYGRQVSLETRQMAKAAYDTMLQQFAVPPEMQLPGTMPAGAGTLPWRRDNPFITAPEDALQIGNDGELDFL